MPLKPDAEQIRNVLNNLSRKNWIRSTDRRWWPQFLFHYTDIRNAAKILRSGFLYSRKYLGRMRYPIVSSGSPQVLARTREEIRDCVRLYFRPLTPTQYHAEGIRSEISLEKSKFPNAHCPVPVFLLFDSYEILSDRNCQFSDGNLGSPRATTFSSATDLEELPWQQIYHNSWIDFTQPGSRNIIFHRHAEVVIPRQLDLGRLRYIYCRSEAERETLLHSLTPDLLQLYRNKIVATTRYTLFYRQHTFVEKAQMSPEQVFFYFSPETKSPGPFHLRVEFKTPKYESLVVEDNEFVIESPHKYKLPLPFSSSAYSIRLFLDGNLTYANSYEKVASPV